MPEIKEIPDLLRKVLLPVDDVRRDSEISGRLPLEVASRVVKARDDLIVRAGGSLDFQSAAVWAWIIGFTENPRKFVPDDVYETIDACLNHWVEALDFLESCGTEKVISRDRRF